MLYEAAQDVRYAIRAARSSPAIAAVAIVSLALGIGANTAIFSLIDAVMLKSLPVSHPEELVQVTMGPQFFSNPIWEQIRDRQDVFSGVFAYGRWSFNLAPGGEVRPVNGQFVSGQYFDTLGVRAAVGRTLTPADDLRGCPGAAVLSDSFWHGEYSGRIDILGKKISIDRHPIEIVGVARRGFTGTEVGSSVDVFVPLCSKQIIHGGDGNLDSNGLAGGRYLYAFLQVMGRLKPEVSVSQANARLKVLAPAVYQATLPRNWIPEDQARYLERTLDAEPAPNGLSYTRRVYRQALMVFIGITGVVLLIACANVANLLLARGAARQREIAIRMALGAGRPRLIRQLLTESLLLSSMGTALGVLFARWITQLGVRSDVFLDLTIDMRVLAFTAGIAIITGLLFGIAPALRNTRVAGSRGVIEGSRFGLGKALVMIQVALSLVLVAGAGLMLSTFWKLTSLHPGFDRDHVLLISLDRQSGATFDRLLERLRAIPGVRSASLSNIMPLCHCSGIDEVAIEGYTPKSREDATVTVNQVSDRYFETLGITVLGGRDFNSHDTLSSPRVAMISQSMARKYFASRNPLGRYFYMRGNSFEIVGIASDVKYGSLRDEDLPFVYTAWRQGAIPGALTSFALRAPGGSPAALIPSVKTVIGDFNPNISMQFTTFAEKVNESIQRERLLATLTGFFGALALLLATIGLYAVMSYNVARRRNEIGIRMALGAQQSRVLRMVLSEVAVLIGAGLFAGLIVTFATTRLVASFLYGLKPNDPLTLVLAVAVLVGAAGLAGYFPARRASRLDPMAALRED